MTHSKTLVGNSPLVTSAKSGLKLRWNNTEYKRKMYRLDKKADPTGKPRSLAELSWKKSGGSASNLILVSVNVSGSSYAKTGSKSPPRCPEMVH